MIYNVPTVATLAADRRDAYLMSLFARLRLTPRGRLMLLSGLAGFQR
jgi:hypothetical protein